MSIVIQTENTEDYNLLVEELVKQGYYRFPNYDKKDYFESFVDEPKRDSGVIFEYLERKIYIDDLTEPFEKEDNWKPDVGKMSSAYVKLIQTVLKFVKPKKVTDDLGHDLDLDALVDDFYKSKEPIL